MKVVILVQARMASTRLPGKVLMPILDKPLLAYLVERLQRVECAHSFAIATSISPLDQPIVDFCEAEDVTVYRGSEEDVLARFYHAAKAEGADLVVRITADCPLIDPALIDAMIQAFLDAEPPITCLSNTIDRSFPRGMDAEVFRFSALEDAYMHAEQQYQREHVTPYIYAHPSKYPFQSYKREGEPVDHLRWTVDEEDDFALVKKVIETLYPKNPNFSLEDLLELFDAHPEWAEINAHVLQKKTLVANADC